MLKFFRKIRKSLVDSGKVQKYVLYAIGEILLVVIGILIALQVNNWNAEKKLIEKEHNYLVALKEELQANNEILKEVILRNQIQIDGAIEMATVIVSKNQQIEEDSFTILFRKVMDNPLIFRYEDAIIREIMSTGSLSIINNGSIKEFLSSWEPEVSFLEKHESAVIKHRSAIRSMVTENGNQRRIMALSGNLERFKLPKGEGDKSNLWLLNSTKYENNLIMFTVLSTTLGKRYESFSEDFESMISIIDNEIN